MYGNTRRVGRLTLQDGDRFLLAAYFVGVVDLWVCSNCRAVRTAPLRQGRGVCVCVCVCVCVGGGVVHCEGGFHEILIVVE